MKGIEVTENGKMAGGQPPFDRMIDQHAAAVLGILRAILTPEDADDCFQETFAAALRKYGGAPIEHPRAWLLTIARNKALDRLRSNSRRRTAEVETGEIVDPRSTPNAGPDPDLWSAVAGLPERQRTAVALRFFGDLSYRRISAAMGGSEVAARRSVADGLANLRNRLDREVLR